MVIVLKLGGSIICDKSRPFAIRYTVLNRIAMEVARFLQEEKKAKLIIIHGGGSFGHYVVYEYFKNKGVLDIDALVTIEYSMLELSVTIASHMIAAGVPVSLITPHGIAGFNLDNSLRIYTEWIERLLEIGTIPLLYGDAVISRNGAIKILSGDVLAWELAHKLRADKLLFATSVDGVYTSNPERPGAELLSVVRLSEINKFSYDKSSKFDVTGGMFVKLKEGIGRIRPGMKVYIFNGLRNNEVYKALKDKPSKGTVIIP